MSESAATWFFVGLTVGLVIACLCCLNLNERWARKSRDVARGVNAGHTEVLRHLADFIPDKTLSDAVKATADTCDRTWAK